MNPSIFEKIYRVVTTGVEYTVIPLFLFMLVQMGLYFRDASYQSIVLNQDWQSSVKAQCSTIPGCLAVSFTSNQTKPAKSANRFALIGTHVTAHFDVTPGTQDSVLERMRRQLVGSTSEHVNLEVARVIPANKKG